MMRAGTRRLDTVKAAAAMEMAPSQLWRLLNQKTGTIYLETLRRLLGALPKHERGILGPAFLDGRAHVVRNGYKAWIAAAREQIFLGASPGWEKTMAGLISRPRRSRSQKIADRQQEFRDLRKQLRAKYPNTFKEFLDKVKSLTIEPERVELALERIVTPLLDITESAFMERDWTAMPPRELRAFLRAGMRRELILLRRAGEAQTAQDLTLGLG
jgi:hypothetical protein